MNKNTKGHDFQEDPIKLVWACVCGCEVNVRAVYAAVRGESLSVQAVIDQIPECSKPSPRDL